MERGGATRPAARGPGRPLLATVPLPRPPALPALLPTVFTRAFPAFLPVALATVLLAAGCGPSGRTGAPAPSLPPHSPAPSPSATAPKDVCARVVAHWARDVHGDYRSMGLSNGQYAILRDAVDAARPVRERQGTAAAHDVIGRHVDEACAARHRTGGPGEGAWR
ncbi:hypothetical protein ABZ678_07810 [Streptomyces hirsutus]|uniref:hypothetical protein n=1 Tax=Streptomyces hirsutus TaxID=35620 RepID=UPI0034087560